MNSSTMEFLNNLAADTLNIIDADMTTEIIESIEFNEIQGSDFSLDVGKFSYAGNRFLIITNTSGSRIIKLSTL